MNELLEKLHEKIVVLADNYRGGNADDDFIHEATNDIIYAASEVYRHPEIKLHMPVSDTGSMMVYQEEGDMNFIPLMLSVDEEQADTAEVYKEVSLKEMVDYAYDNQYHYEMLDNFDPMRVNGTDLSELSDYIRNNIRFQGVIFDPGTIYPYALEGWILKAVFFMGHGVCSFSVIDEETGKVTHKV